MMVSKTIDGVRILEGVLNSLLMTGEILLDIAPEVHQEPENGSMEFFIAFISKVEGWKTRCKNLHWAAKRKNIHVYLDDFLSVLSDYQDSIAEDCMGILGKFSPIAVSGVAPGAIDPYGFIDEVRQGVLKFYDSLPKESVYAGIRSETENFIHEVNKYRYLFSLCHGPQMMD